ncbi:MULTISPECIES: hypothetical protein [Antrihabitans]|jgi:hypothetical protein|uniref:DUF732 domain-containing protein n=2 Tax=Antrihabitans TaxID=2799491 RepID=A0A934U4V1_9NOCA|nr:hypothetical protein [Antrihabitans stalagmiti]MBJ8340158.1 hypothetical protein [Antrihabitans stalagmiti]
MSRRWIAIAGLAAALMVPGCSADEKTGSPVAESSKTSSAASTSSEDESASDDEAVTPLDLNGCVEVTDANLDLFVATTKEDAQKAADVLESYDPPASAKAAIDHFVETGGIQFDDPDYDKYNDAMEKWIDQLCPS